MLPPATCLLPARDYLLCANGQPDRHIVHSHDFNRYLSPFKAEWDPKDPEESVFVIGRYISEAFSGVALHPVDILDASTGALLAQLVDDNLTTISPVNKPHPRRDVIVSGSSRSLYLWAPVREEEEEGAGVEEALRGASAAGGGLLGGGGWGAAAGGSAGTRSPAAAAGMQRRASSRFVSFDADPDSAKKKRKASGGAPSGSVFHDEDDD